MTDHDVTGVVTLVPGTQLGHSAGASTTTWERQSISITLADIACVVAVQQQLRYQNKFNTTKTAV